MLDILTFPSVVSFCCIIYMFASFRKVVAEEERKTLLDECVQLFTAKDRRKGSGYSEGQTFWVSASEEKPKLAIEAFALDVFNRHARGISFDRANSGVEFWPLVIESDDDVGAHFDKVEAFQLNPFSCFVLLLFICLCEFKIFFRITARKMTGLIFILTSER